MRTKELLEIHTNLFKPTVAEQALLKFHEQQVQFEVVPVVGISEGRQSRVSVLEYHIDNCAHRVIWKRMGAGKKLTQEEAIAMMYRLAPYASALSLAGWNIPAQYHSEVVVIDGEHQIFSYEQFVGNGDARFMIANPDEPNFRKWYLMRQSMTAIAQSQLHRQNLFKTGDVVTHRLSYGIDLKLDNLILDESGKLWFVDLFGPKELREDGSWQNYSEKLDLLSQERLLAVCATREGSLLRMARLAERWWHEAGISVEIIRQGIIKCINSLDLLSEEKSFIIDEIQNGFPWLDSIYSEKKV